jgi:DNA-binding transcriptional MerR regulator
MKPGDVADLLGVGRSTVTAWTAGEWREYFSPNAQGGEGRARDLNETDIRILQFISDQKRSGRSSDEIHAALVQMRADGWGDLPPLPSGQNMARVPVVPSAAADAALSAHTGALLREIATLEKRIGDLSGQLADEQGARRADVERFMREMGELRGQLAAALNELELWRKGRLKPE